MRSRSSRETARNHEHLSAPMTDVASRVLESRDGGRTPIKVGTLSGLDLALSEGGHMGAADRDLRPIPP